MAGIVIASVISLYYLIAFPFAVVFEALLHAKNRKVKSSFAVRLISYLVLGFIAGYVISFFVGVLPESRIGFIVVIDIAMFILFIFEIIYEMLFKKRLC
ncbi:hypothetical protein [Paenibacillus sp.]|uniref:hypothetical protein n=1 Tax=Paenibacillus sp. TaxID=58172 RepID=UPI00283AAE2B|nr:hypothetical protein [Paenibacillus sp.]